MDQHYCAYNYEVTNLISVLYGRLSQTTN